MRLHRNSQKRIYISDAAVFITVKTLGNEPYFREPIFCDLFVEELRVCKRLKGFELYGWVLCYDHFHLLLRPNDEFNYSKIMQSLKRHVTRDINWVSGATINEGAIRESRLHSGYGKFAPEIRRLELTVIRVRMRLIFKYDHRELFPMFRWQKSFFDHYCRGETDLRNHLEYILGNPTKHELPKDWRYIFANPKYADLIDEF